MRKFVSMFLVVALCLMSGLAYAGTLTGTVKTAAGVAISSATVTAGSTSATTNSSGVYTMTKSAGTYTVTASKSGYTSVSQSATVPSSGTVTLNFTLTSNTGTLTGTVKTVSGAAISSATVTASGTTATTNSSGVYTMSKAAGTYTVTASKSGYVSQSQSATITNGATTTLNFILAVPSPYTVIARNDLGMHCACPTFEGFLLLPPFNTIKVQVLKKGNDSVTVVSSGITVSYSIAEETSAQLQADPYFASWITNAPKLFPGFQPVVNGVVMGLAGKGITGNATYNSQSMAWEAVGIPAYPITTGNTAKDIMIDPFGGPNRDPYLTANIVVKNSTGAVIGTTSTVVPVAFGGCCTCHLPLAAANGYPATAAGSFAFLGVMHDANSSGINIAMIDPDGDGVGGPVRCSWCHWDPAMGELTAAPGWPAGTQLLPGANFTLRKSTKSFSDVLHRYHNNSALVKSQYDPNIATNCYDCHPGNNVNCYRGAHKGKTAIWCVDCHGNLTQRASTGQLAAPWKASTLPSCSAKALGITNAITCHASVPQTTWDPGLFGKYINGRGGMESNKILCISCHGSPHGESPSTVSADNVENAAIHDSLGTTFPAGKDKTYALGSCQICHTNESNQWSPNVMYGD